MEGERKTMLLSYPLTPQNICAAMGLNSHFQHAILHYNGSFENFQIVGVIKKKLIIKLKT